MTTSSPRGCTNFRARQLSRLLSRRYDSELAACGLKTTQYSLLSHVLHLEPVTPGELARRMGLDASTLTRNLQPLLASGWLVQTEGSDARSHRLQLTEAGRNKQAEARRHWKDAQAQVNLLLGSEQVAALHALIDDCVARLEAAA